MKSIRILISFLFCLTIIFSCHSEIEKKNSSGKSNSLNISNNSDSIKDFTKRFAELIKAMQTQNQGKIDEFISPQFGLLIIESHGAMPFFNISSRNEVAFRNKFEAICNTTIFEGDLKIEQLPKIDCDKENFYSKSGSFVQDTNKLNSSEIWKYGNLSTADEKFAENAIKSVGKTVILTSGYTYYFSFYKLNWYLTIIDTRKPCNA